MKDIIQEHNFYSIFSLYFFIKIIYIFLLVKSIKADDCIISNTTNITIKWLNNIICIGELDFRYVNIATNSNGDLVVETTAIPGNSKRNFYGINIYGEPLFSNHQYHCSFNVTNETKSNNERYEAEIFFVTINNKEYLVSIAKGDRYVELYNLSNCEIKAHKPVENFLNIQITNSRSSVTNYIENNNNYTLLSFINKNSNSFNLMKLNITSVDLNINPISAKNNITKVYGESISCFITDLNYVICFYIKLNNSYYMHIGVYYNSDLKNKTEENTYHSLVPSDNNNKFNYFTKCFHLEGEKGVFAFYRSSNSTSMIKNPLLLFKYFNGSSLNNYTSEIEINKYNFNTYCLLNDIIKISNKTLCFISTSDTKDILYIVLLHIIDKNNIIIRYYSINIFNLYQYKFFLDMRLHLYKNFITNAFSFCRQEICENKTHPHYTGFMIFSYPNGTDYNLNLTEYLYNNNDFKIYNLTIDLKENIRIDNNIFGLVYSGIKIKQITGCNNTIFYSSINEYNEINNNYTLEKNEKIKVNFSSYYEINCSISYIYIITEPGFDEYNNNTDFIVTDYGADSADIFNNNKSKYESRVLYYNIIIDKSLENNCTNSNCELCLEEKKDYCITCKYNYSIDDNIKNKICYLNEDIKPAIETNINISTTQIIQTSQIKIHTLHIIESTQIDIDTTKNAINTTQTIQTTESNNTNCSIDIIFNNKCIYCKINDDQMSEIHNKIKKEILIEGYKGENIIIQTENVIFQISSFEEQKNNINTYISTIDLGECENILKKQYNISDEDSLIVLKKDIKYSDLSPTNVKYEIYNPYTLKELDLVHCKNISIIINIPIKIDDDISLLYDGLSESGHNLFKSNDPFDDICSTFTSENRNDITLEDKQNKLYNITGNLSICQTGCEFKSYNKTTKMVKCNCNVQINCTKNDITKIYFSKRRKLTGFLSTLISPNFLILKCYKLVLSTKDILKNKGRIIMTIIYIIYILSLLFYIIKDKIKICIFINDILINKSNILKLSKNDISYKYERKNKKILNIINNKMKENIQKLNKINIKEIYNKKEPPLKKTRFSQRNNENVNSIEKTFLTNIYLNPKKDSHKINNNINTIRINNLNINNNKNIIKIKNELPKLVIRNNYNYFNYRNLNDKEINILEYNSEINYDKKTYFQYYWSLLKKKQLIIFTILPFNDYYNLFPLKLSLFLLSFSLYFTLYSIIFIDKTMHKTHEDNRTYHIIYLILQILYSSSICKINDMILKMLSLSEINILSLKEIKNIKIAKDKSKSIKACINIKFYIFFIISNILLLFFWYFIACFCVVYTNIQNIFIQDVMVSFGLSMIYPFGLNLLPVMFKTSTLRCKKKNKNCLKKRLYYSINL